MQFETDWKDEIVFTRTRFSPHPRRLVAVAAGLTLAVSLAVAPTANAGSDTDAGTTAEVGGGGTPPNIECGWALNDIDHDWNNLMHYGQDDDAVANPGYPCQPLDGKATQSDGDPLNPVPMIHVLPNAHDNPTEAYVELWGAVDSNTTSTVVYWDVFHPNGSFKVQIDGSRYASNANPSDCVGPHDGTTNMFAAAVATGQVSSVARDNIVAECQNQQKSLWYGAFGISKHQPYGVYKIVMTAVNANGNPVTLTYYIQVLSFYQLEKDFTTINFGQVSSNDHFWQPVSGDFTWDGTDNATNQKSSVRNTGNAGIGLDVRFHSLCLQGAASCTEAKRIDQFDAKFGKTLTGLQSMGHPGDTGGPLWSDTTSEADPAPPGPWYSFDSDINRVLCPNDVAKIEFSIYTRSLGTGTYSANPGIGLRARPETACPTDNGAAYLANGYDGSTPKSNSHWGTGTGAV